MSCHQLLLLSLLSTALAGYQVALSCGFLHALVLLPACICQLLILITDTKPVPKHKDLQIIEINTALSHNQKSLTSETSLKERKVVKELSPVFENTPHKTQSSFKDSSEMARSNSYPLRNKLVMPCQCERPIPKNEKRERSVPGDSQKNDKLLKDSKRTSKFEKDILNHKPALKYSALKTESENDWKTSYKCRILTKNASLPTEDDKPIKMVPPMPLWENYSITSKLERRKRSISSSHLLTEYNREVPTGENDFFSQSVEIPKVQAHPPVKTKALSRLKLNLANCFSKASDSKNVWKYNL